MEDTAELKKQYKSNYKNKVPAAMQELNNIGEYTVFVDDVECDDNFSLLKFMRMRFKPV